MINDKAFEGMKEGMILVNVARGPIVDDEALVRALDSGKGMRPLCYIGWMLIIVRRAALDVFTNEPEIHPGLINDYRVVSPHPVHQKYTDGRHSHHIVLPPPAQTSLGS